MEWSTILGTLTGAIIGVGSTTLTEQLRWKRSREHHWSDVRRELYASYLAALSDGSAALRKVVRESTPDGQDLRNQLHAILLPTGAWRLFHSVAMVGSEEVINQAEVAQAALHEARNILVESPDLTSDSYIQARKKLLLSIANLRNTMREDLNLPPTSSLAEASW